MLIAFLALTPVKTVALCVCVCGGGGDARMRTHVFPEGKTPGLLVRKLYHTCTSFTALHTEKAMYMYVTWQKNYIS